MRKRYDAQFKARIALEAIKGEHTVSEIASKYKVHPNMITKWKKQVLEELPGIFSGKKDESEKEAREREAELYCQIGKLTVELEWLKKKSLLTA